jgi:thiamine-phosphate pyrophosphorylase
VGKRLLDGVVAVKLIKFLGMAFVSISLMHGIAVQYVTDRDRKLSLKQIWTFEGDAVIRDCIAFFVVGRLWQRKGVDNLGWFMWMVLANVYFECQGFFSWMGHSVTLYEMHCLWPWQLWVFVAFVVPIFAAIMVAHVVVAYRQDVLWIKLIELGISLGLFLGPVVTSPYFHFHHWFAGRVLVLLSLLCRYLAILVFAAPVLKCPEPSSLSGNPHTTVGVFLYKSTEHARKYRHKILSSVSASLVLLLMVNSSHGWRGSSPLCRNTPQLHGHQHNFNHDGNKQVFPAMGHRPLLAVITEPNACDSDQQMEATYTAIQQAVLTGQVDLVSVRLTVDDNDHKEAILERAYDLTLRLMQLSTGMGNTSLMFKVVCSSNLVSIAVKSKAHGIHVKERHLDKFAEFFAEFDYPIIIGTSVHSLQSPAAHNSNGLHPHYYFVGTCYMTTSHPEKGQNDLEGPALPGKFKEELAKYSSSIPVFAIGGINENNCHEPVAFGADGVAVIRAVLEAEDPAAAVTWLQEKMTGTVPFDGEHLTRNV